MSDTSNTGSNVPHVSASSKFPFELITEAAGYLEGDAQSLLTICLLSRNWHGASRPVVFRSIWLSTSDSVRSFKALLKYDASVAPWVRRLSVFPQNRYLSLCLSDDVSELKGKLPNLRELELYDIFLPLTGFAFVALDAYSPTFPSIVNLNIMASTFDHRMLFCLVSRMPHLKNVSLVRCTDVNTRCTDYEWNFTVDENRKANLKTFHLVFDGDTPFHYSLREHVESLQRIFHMLDTFGKNLEEFKVELQYNTLPGYGPYAMEVLAPLWPAVSAIWKSAKKKSFVWLGLHHDFGVPSMFESESGVNFFEDPDIVVNPPYDLDDILKPHLTKAIPPGETDVLWYHGELTP